MAQLDNAADSDSEERGFESLWAGQKKASTLVVGVLFFVIMYRDSNQGGLPKGKLQPDRKK